jgi:hypothetical protein
MENELEKEKKLWRKLILWLSILFLVFGALSITAMLIDQKFINDYKQRRTENEAWLILEQSDDEIVSAIHSYFSSETFTYDEKFAMLAKFVQSDLSWRSFFAVYTSHKDWFKSVIDGTVNPQKYVEVNSRVKLYVYLQWSFFALLVFCGIGIAVSVLNLDAIWREKMKVEKEQKQNEATDIKERVG